MNVNDGSGWQVIRLSEDDGTWADYSITAMIYVPNEETNWGRVGIYGRAQTGAYDAACYYLFCDSDGDDYLRCGFYTDAHAEWTQFIDPPGSISRGVWHEFKLDFAGNQIIASIDGTEVYNGTDDTYASGYAGILCYQSNSDAPGTLVDRVTISRIMPTKVDKDNWTIY